MDTTEEEEIPIIKQKAPLYKEGKNEGFHLINSHNLTLCHPR